MATKTWKLGEVCRGGIITAKVTGKKVTIIGKSWDFSQGTRRGSNQKNAKEWTRFEVMATEQGARRKVDEFLNDLTTCYHSDNILKWVESKVKFESIMDW